MRQEQAWMQWFPMMEGLTSGGRQDEMDTNVSQDRWLGNEYEIRQKDTTVSHVRKPDKGRDIWGKGYNPFPFRKACRQREGD